MKYILKMIRTYVDIFLLLRVSQRGDTVHQTLHQDVAVLVQQLVHHPNEICHSLVHCPTEHPAMEILGGAFDLGKSKILFSVIGAIPNLNEKVANSSKAVSETRFVLAQPVVIRDAAVVHLLHELGVLPLLNTIK